MDRLDEIRGRYTPGNYAFRDVGACTLQDISYLLAQLSEAKRREEAAVTTAGVNPDGTARFACPNPQCGHLFWDEQHITAFCPDCGQALAETEEA